MVSEDQVQTAREFRNIIRNGEWNKITANLVPGYTQANLVVLPKELAFDFLLFCQRNPKPCPLLEVVEAGSTEPRQMAPGADLRTDIPKYRVFRNGKMINEVENAQEFWRDDLVSFLIGCSFTFELALVKAGIQMRHWEEGTNVPMYVTSQQTMTAGLFKGPVVVTMRPVHHSQVVRAVQVTSRYPTVHGAPIHIGDPLALGIRDLGSPDYGDPVSVEEGEVPIFWACGVTPQAVAIESKPSFMITHSPGHMFITDVRDEHLSVL